MDFDSSTEIRISSLNIELGNREIEMNRELFCEVGEIFIDYFDPLIAPVIDKLARWIQSQRIGKFSNLLVGQTRDDALPDHSKIPIAESVAQEQERVIGNDLSSQTRGHASFGIDQIGQILDIIGFGDDHTLRGLDTTMHLMQHHIPFLGLGKYCEGLIVRSRSVIHVLVKGAVVMIEFPFEQGVVIRCHEVANFCDLGQDAVNGPGLVATLNCLAQGFFEVASIAAVGVNEIFGDLQQIVSGAIHIIALLRERFGQGASGR